MADLLIVYNRPGRNPSEDELDVITQVEALHAALERTGSAVTTFGMTGDLGDARRTIMQIAPRRIVNCVESLDGSDRMAPAAAALFESLHIPFTGSSSAALAITSDKAASKRIFAAAGLPTPQWARYDGSEKPPLPYPFIIKSATDHASIGITDASVIRDEASWVRWTEIGAENGADLFAEAFVDGREFNVSVVHGAPGGVTVLPPAEIVFVDFPENKPKIVGYDAKWRVDTFEYAHTRRRFLPQSAEPRLHDELVRLAKAAFGLFSLGGYARVDFRADDAGNPFILEVNANPCLSPDAGFCAACAEAGIDYDGMARMIVGRALR